MPPTDYCSADMHHQDNRDCTRERTEMRAEIERLQKELDDALYLHEQAIKARDNWRDEAQRIERERNEASPLGWKVERHHIVPTRRGRPND